MGIAPTTHLRDGKRESQFTEVDERTGRKSYSRVDSVHVFGTGSVGSVEDDFIGTHRGVSLEGRLVDSELVGGKLDTRRERGSAGGLKKIQSKILKLTVPVLSEQRMVTPASSSMAVIRVTIALYLASC